jgi:hypothetical protein
MDVLAIASAVFCVFLSTLRVVCAGPRTLRDMFGDNVVNPDQLEVQKKLGEG